MKHSTPLLGLALTLLTAVPQSLPAQTRAVVSPTAPQVSYAAADRTAATAAGQDALPTIFKMRSHKAKGQYANLQQSLTEHRRTVSNLLDRHGAPLQVTADKLRRAQAAKASRRAPFVPNNDHKHLIVNVVYNSIDATKESGLFALDVTNGDLTCLVDDFEEYENYGFNGGGYIWNGYYRGVFFEQGTRVTRTEPATIMEYDMKDWSLVKIYDLPYHTSMALEAATQYNANGTTTVLGQFWGVNGKGELSLRYCTLDDDGLGTTRFGQAAQKHMMAMGVTSDGRLYGVAKDGNLYEIDRTTAEEKLVGHTGIDDLVDYEGHFWLQGGEIDPRDDTFYWLAEHATYEHTQLCTVDLKTGRAKVIVDFAGDVECAGVVIAPQQKNDATPAPPTKLSATFAPLQTTGKGTFVAPAKRFDGKALDEGLKLYYHVFVNDVEQTVADNQTTTGATVSFDIAAKDVKLNAENTISVTVSATDDGEQSLMATTKAWVGYGIPQAPGHVAMTYDDETHTATITWEAPAKGDDAGVKGGKVDLVNYFVYKVVDGRRIGDIHGSMPLADDTRQITYTLTADELASPMSELTFEVEAWPSPIGFPLQMLASEAASTAGVFVGVGKNVPYYVDIANDYDNVVQSEFTAIDGNGNGKTWAFYPPHVSVGNMLCGAVVCPNYSAGAQQDDWLVLPAIVFQAGKTYRFRSYMHGPSANSPWVEMLEVKLGTNKTAQSMTQLLYNAAPVVDYCYVDFTFTVPEDGNYFVGLHSVSAPDQWEIAVFDVSITEVDAIEGDLLAPDVADVTATPVYGVSETTDAAGKKTYTGAADLSLKLPRAKRNGTPLGTDDVLTVSITATGDAGTQVLAELTGQAPGATIDYSATGLVSGSYTFSAVTSYTDAEQQAHKSLAATATAYVGWDNAVANPTGMELIQSADKLIIRLPEHAQPTGAHGAYLPSITYRAYGGDKANTIGRAMQAGYIEILNQIPADAETQGTEMALDFEPQVGGQYNRHYYVLALSTDAQGKLIASMAKPVTAVVGEPLQAPAIETGEQTYIIDANLDDRLDSLWRYYLERGQSVCGVVPIEDQFGFDVGKSWNVYSAFNGNLDPVFCKVDISSLAQPVLDFDLILEDPETSMAVVLNGPDGQRASHPLTAMDGMQHISLPLDDYKSWGWVQPTLHIAFHAEEEGHLHDVFFDNVGVFDAVATNLAVIAFEMPQQMKSGEETMANVTVMNMGQQPVQDFSVVLTEDDTERERQTFSRPLAAREILVAQFRYRANTVYDFDVEGQEEAEKVLVASVEAEGDLMPADNSAEAVLTVAVEGGKANSYPSQAKATQAEGSTTVDVSWAFDLDETTELVTESFEDYERWSLGGVRAGAKNGQIGPWRLYDGDNKPTYTWDGFSRLGYGGGEPMAFQVFSGEIFPAGYSDYDMTALTGAQYLVSMDPADGDYTPKADDYLISPRVKGGSYVEFYYGSLVNQPQSVEVWYSENSQELSDFRLLEKLDNAASTDWQLGYFTLPEKAKYFALRHSLGSYMGYGLKVDDVTYSLVTSIDHFCVYVDGRLVGTTADTRYTISEPLEPGEHKIAVTAVFADGRESMPAYATIDYADAIARIMATGQPVDVYSLDGKLVRRQTRSLDGLHGTFVVAGKTVVLQ